MHMSVFEYGAHDFHSVVDMMKKLSYISTYIHIYMHIYTHIYIYIYIFIHIYPTHSFTVVDMKMRHTYVHTHMHANAHTHRVRERESVGERMFSLVQCSLYSLCVLSRSMFSLVTQNILSPTLSLSYEIQRPICFQILSA